MKTAPKGPLTWRTLCLEAGIEPTEVETVASRYRAYRDFMAPRGGGLTLDGWFRFYRLEKQAESPDQTGGGERLLGDWRGCAPESADQSGGLLPDTGNPVG